jgi:Domain of unknown function DUF29
MTDLKTLYQKDTAAWSENQAAALRAAAQGRSNQELDWENLAEEIGDLGKSQCLVLRSRLATIIEHLVKLQYSPALDPRHGWQQTIRRERNEIERLLDDSPSLNREVADLLKRETKRAVDTALADLRGRNELDPPLEQALKSKSYLDLFVYGRDEVIGDWFPTRG